LEALVPLEVSGLQEVLELKARQAAQAQLGCLAHKVQLGLQALLGMMAQQVLLELLELTEPQAQQV
jgi:hypothetical protein